MSEGWSGRGLSLDLDGTLYRVVRWRIAWRLRKQRKLLVAMLKTRDLLRGMDAFESGEAYLKREAEMVAEKLGAKVSIVTPDLKSLKINLAQAATRGNQPFSGVRESLEWAHSQGVRLAVFSDYAPTEKLSHLGLDTLPWSICMGAETCGALKPNPRGFNAIAEAMNLDSASVVHIGDREDLDIRGAQSAGQRAALWCPSSVDVQSKPERAGAGDEGEIPRLRVWTSASLEALLDTTRP